jgi:hypothetical protein
VKRLSTPVSLVPTPSVITTHNKPIPQSLRSFSNLVVVFSSATVNTRRNKPPTQRGAPPTFVQRAQPGWLGRRPRVAGHAPNQRPPTRAGRLALKPTAHMRYGACEREAAGQGGKSRFGRGRGRFRWVEFGAGLGLQRERWLAVPGAWPGGGLGGRWAMQGRCGGELGGQMGWLSIFITSLPVSRQCGARSAVPRGEGGAGVWC